MIFRCLQLVKCNIKIIPNDTQFLSYSVEYQISQTHSFFTCMNFIATSLKPFFSKRLMISPTRPRWTPSGLIMINVRSFMPAMFDEQESSCLMQLSVDDVAVEGETKLIKKCAIAKIVQIITLLYKFNIYCHYLVSFQLFCH